MAIFYAEVPLAILLLMLGFTAFDSTLYLRGSGRVISRLALKIVVMARQEAKGKRQEARGFGRFYVSLHSLVLLCSPT